MSADITPYEDLITSEHRDKPNFMATLATLVQPVADCTQAVSSLPGLFDLDVAEGDQLDTCGGWIGISRFVQLPLTGQYFSFDTSGVGFDQGIWFVTGDATTSTTALADDLYRALLKAKVVANQWDGSIPKAYEAWATLFEGTGVQVYIIDHGDYTMSIGVTSPTPLSLLFKTLIQGGYLDLRPAGVTISSYIIP